MPSIINSVVSEQTIASIKSQQQKTFIDAFSARFMELVSEKNPAIQNGDNNLNKPHIISFAPGRINLIGEHVDYLGGNVLPAAIDKGVFCFGLATNKTNSDALSSTNESKISDTWTIICHDGKEAETFTESSTTDEDGGNSNSKKKLSVSSSSTPPRWARYVVECFNQIQIAPSSDSPSTPPKHFYVGVFSTLPVGAGLSSSAAFNISITNLIVFLKHSSIPATSKTLPPSPSASSSPPFTRNTTREQINSKEDAENFEAYRSRLDIALLAQQTEHRTGTMCGIMDQLASLFGAPSTCLLTDCDLCQVSAVSLDKLTSRGVSFLLINSVVAHELGDAYNKLRQALERAQNALTAFYGSEKGPFSAVQWAKKELEVYRSNSATATTKVRPFEIADQIGKKLMKIAIDEAKASPEDALKLSYVAAETCRTILFCSLLQSSETDDEHLEEYLGELMNGTHDGLSKILNVSTPELDFIHEYLARREQQQQKSQSTSFRCFGSRMMGGGFGGCVLCLVKTENGSESIKKFMEETEDFMPTFASKFFPNDADKKKNFAGVWYDVSTGGGASLIM